MNITNEENRFLNRLLAVICRLSKHEINEETWRPGGPRKEEIAAMRQQQRLARELIRKLDLEIARSGTHLEN